MSRCFPFPPPGYEKKITATDSDLLKKEKRREKKHKKEKKDKEKKDDKEKKESDRNDGKRKEKKDKEKHRDKKKEKDREKNQQRDDPSLSGDARLKVPSEGNTGQIVNHNNLGTGILRDDSAGKAVGYNGENLGHYTSLAGKPNGVKLVQDFDRRIRDNTTTVRGPIDERITPVHHKRNVGGETFNPNGYWANNFKDSDLALELDRRLKNESEQPYHQNQTANKLISAPHKKDGGAIKSSSLGSMERSDNRIKSVPGKHDQAKAAGITVVPYVSTPAQSNPDRIPRPPLRDNTVMEIAGQERLHHREDELQKQGNKRKDKDRNGDNMIYGANKSRDKVITADKGNDRIGQNRSEQARRDSHKMDTLGSLNYELHTEKQDNSNISKEEEMNQTREILKNGIYQVNGPSKLSRPSSVHFHNDSGREPEPCQIPLKPSLDGRGATNIIKVDKVGKINGVIQTQVQHPATEQVFKEKASSPHPDAKRLNEILSVPKIEELSEVDDSDWLFIGTKRVEKKPRVDDSHTGASASTDTPQIWSKAANIELADVYALPYVIPY